MFFEFCFDYGGVFCGFKLDDSVCPELHDACGDWCCGGGLGFVEDAFDLAGDDDGYVLGFCGLCEECHLSVEFSV